jgi:hypothetical protein
MEEQGDYFNVVFAGSLLKFAGSLLEIGCGKGEGAGNTHISPPNL